MAKPANKATTEVATTDEQSQEVAIHNAFTEEELRGITSFEDAVRLLYRQDIAIDDAAQVLGDGFAMLKDEKKSLLVGVPLLLMEWNFWPGDYGDTFVGMRIVAQNPDKSASKYIVNDGSTGIAEALKKYTARTGKTSGLFVPNGFRESKYTYCQACINPKTNQPGRPLANGESDDEHRDAKQHIPAITYYLDTTA